MVDRFHSRPCPILNDTHSWPTRRGVSAGMRSLLPASRSLFAQSLTAGAIGAGERWHTGVASIRGHANSIKCSELGRIAACKLNSPPRCKYGYCTLTRQHLLLCRQAKQSNHVQWNKRLNGAYPSKSSSPQVSLLQVYGEAHDVGHPAQLLPKAVSIPQRTASTSGRNLRSGWGTINLRRRVASVIPAHTHV